MVSQGKIGFIDRFMHSYSYEIALIPRRFYLLFPDPDVRI